MVKFLRTIRDWDSKSLSKCQLALIARSLICWWQFIKLWKWWRIEKNVLMFKIDQLLWEKLSVTFIFTVNVQKLIAFSLHATQPAQSFQPPGSSSIRKLHLSKLEKFVQRCLKMTPLTNNPHDQFLKFLRPSWLQPTSNIMVCQILLSSTNKWNASWTEEGRYSVS